MYDLALHIYGAVEGITDLMANNESLSLDDDLRVGDELIYSDDYVINKEVAAYYQTHGIVPSSGEQHVYPKTVTLPLALELYVSERQIGAEFSVSGSGKIEMDWGDNTPVEVISLTDTIILISHLFDAAVRVKRKVSMYIDGELKSLDTSGFQPTELYILKPIYCERFVLNGATLLIDSLPMLRGVFDLRLEGLKTDDLLPLVELKGLMSLSLCGTVYRQPTIDAYLIGLVRRHDNRRNCRVLLHTQPSGAYAEPKRDADNRYILASGMEAVWVLTHEEAWNEGGNWEFMINDICYKYEPND